MKKAILPLLAASAALFLTACGDKEAETKPIAESSKTEATSITSDEQMNLKMAAAAADMDPKEIQAMIDNLKLTLDKSELTDDQKLQLKENLKLLEMQMRAVKNAAAAQ